jgi:thiol-disulfide isomerase/thioredoxin
MKDKPTAYFPKPAVWLFLVIGLISTFSFGYADAVHHVKILFFFSESCRHCMAAKPSVIDLSKEYEVEGLIFGGEMTQPMPFPVKTGDKKIAREKYGVSGYPTLAILIDGVYRQKITGASDVQDAKAIIKALANGAVTVTEASKNRGQEEITVTGWVVARGEYFKKAQFAITDRTTELPVRAWLPLEAMKSPFSKNRRLRLMSDVVKKPVMLKGSIKRTATGGLFQVKEEIRID